MKRLHLACFLIFLSSCGSLGWLGKSEEQEKLETGASSPTVIPQGLDKPEFNDPMPIPEIRDYRGLANSEIELGLPDALATNFGVEQILIRRLGDSRWVFIDLPVATVWPRVLLFWEEMEFPLSKLDGRSGLIETDWIAGIDGDSDGIYESLNAIRKSSAEGYLYEYRFKVRVESGVRSGSTEIYVEETNRLREASVDDSLVWDGVSDNQDLEAKMLSSLAYYIGERIAEGPSISLVAATRQESKVDALIEADGTVLEYKLDFNRTWATVGRALEDAGVEVVDRDRSAAIYYVSYSSIENSKAGFIRRLLKSDNNAEAGRPFRVVLSPNRNIVRVDVAVGDASDQEPEDLVLRERLVKLIKEYST